MRTDKSVFAALALAGVLTAVSCGSGSGSSAVPTPVPVSTVTAPLPWVYSQIFSTTSPFHTTVATLLANGAIVLPQSAMTALWSQGVADQDLSTQSWMFPVYVSVATDPVKTFSCTKWGACSANNVRIHVPAGAMPEPQSDGHLGIIDTALNIEVDGWQCAVTGTTVDCAWGTQYSYGSNGLENTGSNAVHGGYAAGLFVVTAQEIESGHIDHALGMVARCLNDPTVYPADQHTSGTDASCGDTGPPSYGDLVHLKWSAAQIASSSYSPECKIILTAMATYGAYTFDTGNNGIGILTQHPLSYTSIGQANPWATTILPDLVAAGDGKGTYWNSCLNRLTASDFELLQIPAGSY